MLAGSPGVPRSHVPGAADGSHFVEHWFESFGVLEADGFPHVLDDPAHVEGEHKASSRGVIGVVARSDANAIAGEEPLDEGDELGEEVIPVSFPGWLHQIEYIARGLEHDPLHSQSLRQFRQINLGDLPEVGLALDDWSQLGELTSLGDIQLKREKLGRLELEYRLVRVIDAGDVRPRQLGPASSRDRAQ